ncbi:hypothetical protein GCM10009717_25530 [Agromyces allii]|uniref:Uncharacterized protein n=1 Tax=Agromyces allii TaxID=393607 RepID=A0ABP5C7D2_9MICO
MSPDVLVPASAVLEHAARVTASAPTPTRARRERVKRVDMVAFQAVVPVGDVGNAAIPDRGYIPNLRPIHSVFTRDAAR